MRRPGLGDRQPVFSEDDLGEVTQRLLPGAGVAQVAVEEELIESFCDCALGRRYSAWRVVIGLCQVFQERIYLVSG
jgi:hypothetical protein